MRVINETQYVDSRDCISIDWYKYLKHLEVDIVLIPNLGDEISSWLNSYHFDRIVFSGGGDIQSDCRRYVTEKKILDFCQDKRIPLLGVCRGMQMLNEIYGGKCVPNKKCNSIHVNNEHPIVFNNGNTYTVNSFHDNLISESNLADCFEILGYCPIDQSVEVIKKNNLLGVMWHPERNYLKQDKEIAFFVKNYLLNGTI